MSRATAGKIALVISLIACLLCLFVYLVPRKPQARVGDIAMIKNVLGGKFENLTAAISKLAKKSASMVQGYGSMKSNPVLDVLRAEGAVVLPSKEEMKTMSADALYRIYHSYLDNTNIICNRKLRMGLIGDGGWEICDDEVYRPRHPCIVYSYGINGDFSFDDDTARVYQCKVYSFDPSMKTKSYQRTPNNAFYDIGIAGKDTVSPQQWTMKTLSSTKQMLNHSGMVIDVLKMDVESAEWNSLPQMIQSGELRRVRQFLVEYHGSSMNYNHLAILKDLHDLGFRKFYVHKNFVCVNNDKRFPITRTACYEVHYVNINSPVGKIDLETGPYWGQNEPAPAVDQICVCTLTVNLSYVCFDERGLGIGCTYTVVFRLNYKYSIIGTPT